MQISTVVEIVSLDCMASQSLCEDMQSSENFSMGVENETWRNGALLKIST